MSDSDSFGSPPVAGLRKNQHQQRRESVGLRLLQSPISQNPRHLLGSNDDQRERAQARAARAAASRRKSVVASRPQFQATDGGGGGTDLFDRDQIVELFNNCIKLASENKINQKNTWDLGLIDHLSELIRVESDDDAETNFQKASCTLEAGVKIYSLRVDSAHSEAYKVLGGINRVGREDDSENLAESDDTDGGKEEGLSKKEQEKKLSPLSTLESSFEALNVKKFDVAFTVDPLYHQTSAQFDEGGAKGLLLSNLGVYGGCKVLFDSFEAPEKSMSCEMSLGKEQIDLSFAREQIEQMMINMPMKNDISPTLEDIINHFDEDNHRPPYVIPAPMTAVEQDDMIDNGQVEWEGHETGPCDFDPDDQTSVIDETGSCNFDPDDQTTVVDNDFCVTSNPNHHQEENDGYSFQVSDNDERLITGFLSLGLGYNSKVNAWAGPEHWKYRKVKDPEQPVNSKVDSTQVKKQKNRKQVASNVEFTKSLETQMADIFVPPKNPKTLLLPVNRAPCSVTLPEDCHYQPENLVKLFLLPGAMCLGKKAKKFSDGARQQDPTYDPKSAWDNEDAVDDLFDAGNSFSDVADLGDLVSQPRQVSKIEVEYDKFSKQVDVHALKEILWNQIQESVDTSQIESEIAVSFTQILGSLSKGTLASSAKGSSPHLSFICLLHLANEHGLRICDTFTLDELHIYLPRSAVVGY